MGPGRTTGGARRARVVGVTRALLSSALVTAIAIRDLRRVALLEGISLILLFGVAMPLKYGAGMPGAVTLIGFIHGVLFSIYAMAVVHVLFTARWSLLRGVLLIIAGSLPLATFVADRWLRGHQARAEAAR
jgi:integral membrane protein